VVEVLAGAEGAPAILPGPRQERSGRIVGADGPLTEGDGFPLGRRRDAVESIAEGVAGNREIFLEEIEELVGATVVAGAAYTVGDGHEDHPFVVEALAVMLGGAP
jgi:hypothetical protein